MALPTVGEQLLASIGLVVARHSEIDKTLRWRQPS